MFAIVSIFMALLTTFPLSGGRFIKEGFFGLVFLVAVFFKKKVVPAFVLVGRLRVMGAM